MFGYKWLTLELLVLFLVSAFVGGCSQDETLSFGQECPGMQRIVVDANRVCEVGGNLDGLADFCEAYLPYFEAEQCPSRLPRCVDGSCQSACGPMMVACDGVCTNPLTSNTHCGAKGDCQASSAGEACIAGTICKEGICQDACPASQIYCNGRCIDPESDKEYCGAQKGCTEYTSCASAEVCRQSKCSVNCLGDQVLCADRCIDPKSEREFCGASNDCKGSHVGTSCSERQVCEGGRCQTGCYDNRIICGGVCVDPKTDQKYCGADARCTGYSSCLAGQVCEDAKCVSTCKNEGELLCEGKCIDPQSNDNYCGAKDDCKALNRGIACSPWGKCQDSICIDSCPIGQIMCSNACISASKDMINCGASSPCSTNPGVNCVETTSNAHDVSCTASVCNYGVCKAGFLDCDGKRTTGCETDPKSSVNNCGTCGNDCTRLWQVEVAKCAYSLCVVSKCAPGFGNCNGNVSDGCETNTKVAPNHCGVCGNNCSSLPNVLRTRCTNGGCDIEACVPGFYNCNALEGCETMGPCP